MTIKEYFGDWAKIMDLEQINQIMHKLLPIKESICPTLQDVFKAFQCCPLKDLRVVIIGQDPYPTIRDNKPIATGIAFANSPDTPPHKLSPSLEVLRESVINFSLPHGSTTFDVSLEKWEKQGVLLLNTALTCLKGKPGSHFLLWYPFITHFLQTLSEHYCGVVYVLMGSQAASLKPYIKGKNYILQTQHPSYYARTKEKMPNTLWRDIDNRLYCLNGYGIQWYEET